MTIEKTMLARKLMQSMITIERVPTPRSGAALASPPAPASLSDDAYDGAGELTSARAQNSRAGVRRVGPRQTRQKRARAFSAHHAVDRQCARARTHANKPTRRRRRRRRAKPKSDGDDAVHVSAHSLTHALTPLPCRSRERGSSGAARQTYARLSAASRFSSDGK